MAQEPTTAGQAIARVNGTVPRIAAAGRKGFRAELDDLREHVHGLGLGHSEIAAEVGRRYRVRPREAYRLAYGWTLVQAAARFNACAAGLGTDPDGLASLAGNRLCEYEKWPHSQRRPSVYVLVMLALVYETGVLDLLDLADHENLPPRDRLTLLQPGPAAPARPDLSTAAGAAQGFSQPGAAPPGVVPGPLLANAQGISLSLPYVPGRVVIEVTDPALSTGRGAAGCGGEVVQAIPLLRQTPVPVAVVPAPAGYGGRT
jgi:hypothetical protein